MKKSFTIEEFSLPLEDLLKKLKIPYSIFAIIVGIYVPVLVVLLDPSGVPEYKVWFIEEYGFLYSICVTLMLIVLRELRNVTIEFYNKLHLTKSAIEKLYFIC